MEVERLHIDTYKEVVDERPLRPRASTGGFTLIELLVVVSIIGFLVILLLPAVQSAREASRRAACVNNLKQLGVAIHAYVSTNGCFPPGRFQSGDRRRISGALACRGPEDRSIFVALLPQLEQNPLYDAVNFDVWIHEVENHTVMAASLGVLACPSDEGAGRTRTTFPEFGTKDDSLAAAVTAPAGFSSYSGCISDNGEFVGFLPKSCLPDPNRLALANGLFNDVCPILLSSVTDGTSSTVAMTEKALASFKWIVERYPDDLPTYDVTGVWTSSVVGNSLLGLDAPPNAYRLVDPSSRGVRAWSASSFHPGGVNALMADGSVHFIRDSIQSNKPLSRSTPGVWQFLATRNGSEVIDANAY